MKIRSTWTLFFVHVVLLSWTTVVQSRYCSNTQFECRNKRCIPQIWKCDDDDDCGDNSDETSCPVKACSDDEFKCKNGTKCIPSRWKCDGDADCEDGSDEEPATCLAMTCTEDQFACGKNQSCIPLEWKCDQQVDCKNGADERGCPRATCEADQFHCNNGNCISFKWTCDQDDDCGDNSDEVSVNCGEYTCGEKEFKCTGKNFTRCIPEHWKCDGDQDCVDGSDENQCQNVENNCRESEFQCATSKLCIHKSWHCDGDYDCMDNSDETGCPATTCRPSEFQCGNHHCIPGSLQCNGQADCEDGTDEKFCDFPTRPQCDKRTQFDCYGDGSQCVELTHVCDHTQQCDNGMDESVMICRLKRQCEINNGGCSDLCQYDSRGITCACSSGFKLDKNGKTCDDVNECQEIPGLCSQVCENVKGHYKCHCKEGYWVDPENPHGCRLAKNNATIIFSNRYEVRVMDIRKRNYTTVFNETRSAVALDFDLRRNAFFYTDSAEEKIYHVTKDGKRITLDIKVAMPDGIAYDWIHHNLYWTDTGKDVIGVISLDGGMQRILVDHADGLDEPRSIVVDPLNGWMYWSDWGQTAAILRAGMDGSHVEKIVQRNILWPNGITIDYASSRLFWVDAKLHTISSSDLNGGNRYTVLTSMTALSHPFAITVFEDYVYWTDWDLKSIQRVIKMNPAHGSNRSLDIHPMVNGLYSPMDLHVYHPERQPVGENLCADSPCAAHQFCLPAPYFNKHSARVACLCPMGLDNCNDGRREKTPSIHSGQSAASTPSKNRIPKGYPTKKPLTTPHNRDVTTSSLSPGKNDTSAAATSSNGVGTIAAAVSGAVAAVLIIVVIIGVLVYRYFGRKNVKSMNFDNPVYRKTTEDQFAIERHQYQPANRLASHGTPSSNQFVRLTQEDDDQEPMV